MYGKSILKQIDQCERELLRAVRDQSECQKLGKPNGICLQRVQNINKREIPLLSLTIKRTTHVNEVDPNFAIFRIWRWAGLGELGERWATFSHIYTQYYVLTPTFSDSHDPDPRNPAV